MALIEKIANQIYQKEYAYLDFLNHTMADCEEGLFI